MSLLATHLPCDSCGSSDAVAEYTTSTFCFSCLNYTPKKLGKNVAVQFEEILEAEKLEIPKSATNRLPLDAQRWLWEFDVSDEQVQIYNLLYIPQAQIKINGMKPVTIKNRLVLPKYARNGEIEFMQFRSLDGSNPKYYTVGAKGIFESKQFETVYLVIVEDVLSAIRVGELASSIALCGTSISDTKLLQLAKKYDKIIIWLDGDEPGRRASAKLKKRLNVLVDTVEIKTEKDPKCHTIPEIEGNISVALRKLAELSDTKTQ